VAGVAGLPQEAQVLKLPTAVYYPDMRGEGAPVCPAWICKGQDCPLCGGTDYVRGEPLAAWRLGGMDALEDWMKQIGLNPRRNR
jgi:hypothetical protein